MKLVFVPYFFVIYLVIFIVSFKVYFNYDINLEISNRNIIKLNEKCLWPVIGYNKISSYFGKRTSPVSGSSVNHKGIDIPAPYGANIISLVEGIVIFAGFNGSGGHTIIVQNDNIEYIYCHVDGNNYPQIGQKIYIGEIIGKVGPKNVYDIKNNPYKDSNGNPTNGATTGSHLHFAIKIQNEYVNPLNYL